MIDFAPHARGVILPVRALPGAKSDGIRGIQAGHLKIGVTQVAEKGKANKALRDFIAKQLRLPKSRVELISGATSAQKRFLIHDIDRDTLEAQLHRLLR